MEYLWLKGGIMLVVAIGAGVKALQAVGQRSAGRRRMRAGQRQIADLTVVTLTGVVRAVGEPLEAPLSGTPCVVHRSSARVFRSASGFGRRGARVVDSEFVIVDMVDFVLETRDGPVLVTGRDVDVTIRPGAIVPRRLEREAKFLRAAGHSAHPSTCGFDEVVIEPGAKISVHGVARIEADGAAAGEQGYRDAPMTTRIVGDAAHPLTIAE